jgi:cell division protein FtsB
MLTETQGWTLLTALTGTDLAAMGREMAEAEAKLEAARVLLSRRVTRLVAAVKALAQEDGQ